MVLESGKLRLRGHITGKELCYRWGKLFNSAIRFNGGAILKRGYAEFKIFFECDKRDVLLTNFVIADEYKNYGDLVMSPLKPLILPPAAVSILPSVRKSLIQYVISSNICVTLRKMRIPSEKDATIAILMRVVDSFEYLGTPTVSPGMPDDSPMLAIAYLTPYLTPSVNSPYHYALEKYKEIEGQLFGDGVNLIEFRALDRVFYNGLKNAIPTFEDGIPF
jgi:hypothetical protein